MGEEKVLFRRKHTDHSGDTQRNLDPCALLVSNDHLAPTHPSFFLPQHPFSFLFSPFFSWNLVYFAYKWTMTIHSPHARIYEKPVDRLDYYYQAIHTTILSKQNAVSGLIPASVAITVWKFSLWLHLQAQCLMTDFFSKTHGDYTDAWVRYVVDNKSFVALL